jgi:hypothetical protein
LRWSWRGAIVVVAEELKKRLAIKKKEIIKKRTKNKIPREGVAVEGE